MNLTLPLFKKKKNFKKGNWFSLQLARGITPRPLNVYDWGQPPTAIIDPPQPLTVMHPRSWASFYSNCCKIVIDCLLFNNLSYLIDRYFKVFFLVSPLVEQ